MQHACQHRYVFLSFIDSLFWVISPLFQAVLEKQSYMLIGRHDIEKLMRLDPASACLPNAPGHSNINNLPTDAETVEVESELCNLLLNLRPIKQVFLLLKEISSLVHVSIWSTQRCYLFFFIVDVNFLRENLSWSLANFAKLKYLPYRY